MLTCFAALYTVRLFSLNSDWNLDEMEGLVTRPTCLKVFFMVEALFRLTYSDWSGDNISLIRSRPFFGIMFYLNIIEKVGSRVIGNSGPGDVATVESTLCCCEATLDAKS